MKIIINGQEVVLGGGGAVLPTFSIDPDSGMLIAHITQEGADNNG